jgi:hypothetical protein
VATSIKSIDLNAATYQNAANLTSTLNRYINLLVDYDGSSLNGIVVPADDITSRILSLAIPKGSMTPIQIIAIESARTRARELGLELLVTPF